jgi:hypothetical protein
MQTMRIVVAIGDGCGTAGGFLRRVVLLQPSVRRADRLWRRDLLWLVIVIILVSCILCFCHGNEKTELQLMKGERGMGCPP